MADRIPDPDLLFCRVHRTQFNVKENRISRAVFEKLNQSADWEHYSTEEMTVAPVSLRETAAISAKKWCMFH